MYNEHVMKIMRRIILMINDKKKIIAIIFISLSILVEILGILLCLVPMAGFIIYIFMTLLAIGMAIIGWITSKEHRALHITSSILFCIYLIGIIADISIVAYFFV